jgi:methylenetetrahydrofolate reductase (NADPH)
MHTIFSFEVFPPKKTMGIDTIYKTLDDLRNLKPDFISVTYGAGGSVDSSATLSIAERIRSVCGVEAVAHMPCLYMSRAKAEDMLHKLRAAEIGSILALRGDRQEKAEQPHISDAKPAGDFQHAGDLVSFIREFDERHHDGKRFTVFGACYPEKHPESPDVISDIHALKAKVDAGVSRLISQLFFDNDAFYRFLERARLASITIPVEAGIMPVINKKQIEHMTAVCGTALPEKFRKILDKYGDSPEALRDAGIAYAVDQIADLVTQGVDGIHLYTMNNAYAANRINNAVRSLF